jgi:5-formyltetrahydrofolate cyclo-ligase
VTDKPALRAEARRRLRGLSADERERAEAEIDWRIWTVPEVSGAATVLLFADLPEEVTTDRIAADALSREVTLIYPRTLPGSRLMTLHRVRALDELRTGQYGIREPDAERCPPVPLASVDAALVPGLAWDRRGGRLGRGAGYYDRLFAHPAWRGFRCGIFFSFQEMETIPMDPWDVPLQAVATEREVWRLDGG